MRPMDVLKFEAHFQSSVNEKAFGFSINESENEGYASATFGSIMGRKYACVTLFDSEESFAENERLFRTDTAPLTGNELCSFVESFIGVPEKGFDNDRVNRMMDVRAVSANAAKMLEELQGFSKISFFAEGDEVDCRCFSDVSLSVYTQLVSAMLFAADTVSSDRAISLRLSERDMGIHLSVTTGVSEEMAKQSCKGEGDVSPNPAAGYIDVCRYVAAVENGEFSYNLSWPEKTASFELTISRTESDAVEFKAPESETVLQKAMAFAVAYLLLMRS